MKYGAQEVNLAEIEIPKEEPGIVADFMAITKARLSLLVLITTFVGFCMGSRAGIDWLLLIHTLIGTALVAASAAIFNQAVEVRVDALMERTRDRPLPAGRMRTSTAFLLGAVSGILGVIYLDLLVNLSCAGLAAATLGIYILIYTPMKRRTSFCVTIGAVSGAIPPVIGWTASNPEMSDGAWILFGVLFCWQMPHFLAIAWMYRDEYAQAGFRMLRRNDQTGLDTAWRALFFAAGLVVVTILPSIQEMAGPIYLPGALALNAVMVFCAIRFVQQRTRASARQLFFASIFYLPFILSLMVFTRT
jgi:protoheme IX farnesyltransferase